MSIVRLSYTSGDGAGTQDFLHYNTDYGDLAQQITTEEAIENIDKITLNLKKILNPDSAFGNMTLRVETDDGSDDPSGNLVTNGSSNVVAESGLGTSYGEVDFTFGTPFDVAATTKYHLVLTTTRADGSAQYVAWHQNASGGYAGGLAQRENDAAAWVAVAQGDYYFKIWGDPILQEPTDSLSIAESSSKTIVKVLADSQAITENISNRVSIGFEESLSFSETLLIHNEDDYYFRLNDEISFAESLTSEVGHILGLNDTLSIAESIANAVELNLTDTEAIAEQVSNQGTLNLSDSQTISDAITDIELTEGIVLSTGWKFYIRNSSGDRVASLVNARDRWFREALNHGGAAGFTLDTTDASCNSTILATNQNELIIEYDGYTMWGGQISTIKKIAKNNDKYWEITAKQFFNLLEKRYCGYNKSTGISVPRVFTTTDAGALAWTLIDESQSESNGDFGFTEGSIETSLNRTKEYERKNIAQAILELSESDYGFDFEITPAKVFNVYYPFKGETKNDVVFRYPGNCFGLESLENGWDVVNHELGLGKHWGGEEIQYVADDVTSQAAYTRREAIASYKDMEILAYLTNMVDEDIATEKDINKVIKFSSFIDSKTEPYLYELGDAIRLVADDFNVNENLFVYERRFTIDDDDTVVVDLTLGD